MIMFASISEHSKYQHLSPTFLNIIMLTSIASIAGNIKEAKEGVEKVDAELKAVKDDIDKEKLKRKIWQTAIEEKIAAAEFKDPVEDVTPVFQKKISSIEKELADIKKAPTITVGADEQTTAIFGGLGAAGGIKEAGEWLQANLGKFGISMPTPFINGGGVQRPCLDALPKRQRDEGSNCVIPATGIHVWR